MFSITGQRVREGSKRISLAIAAVIIVAVALTFIGLSVQPAVALTNGQAVTASFPRVAMWWPNSSTPSADLAELDYLVPYEWQPMQPNTNRLATLRAANTTQTLFADASTCELNYRQPDSAGNPSGPVAYDAERIGAIPTSWILTQVGSTLSAAITTVSKPTQSISVADSTKFRAGNLVIIEDEKCLVVSVSSGAIVVRRGWAGSTAVNHAAGTRIAAAVSAWPYSVKVDLTDDCPQGRATGEIATPGSGTERGRDWMVRRTAAHYKAAGFDGVAIDLGIGYISWFKGTDVYSYQSIASRSNLDAEVDYTAYDAKWAASLNTFQSTLRTALGPDAIILVNEATPAFSALNGSRIEGFPKKTTSSRDWYQKVIGPNKAAYPSYLEWCASARQPNFTTIQTYADAVNDYQLMRFGLTTALMGDGFYAFKVSHTNGVNRYDEFDNAGAGRGYLGKPIGAMRSVVTLSSADIVGAPGTFSDAAALGAWTLYSRSGYAASKAIDDGTGKVAVTQSAGSIGGVELTRANVAVSAGAAYTLSFRARADRPMNVQGQVQQAGSPYTTYMGSPVVPLTTEWRTFDIPMKSSGTDAAAVLKFTLGQSVGTIWLDDVKLQAGDRNAYARDYEGGIALVNATDAAVTVDLGGTFRKIKGTQAPQVNDGSLVTQVTLQPKDGLCLLRTEPAIVPVPVTVTPPASVSPVVTTPPVVTAPEVVTTPEVVITPAVITPTVVSTPVVKRQSKKTYTVSGSVRLGSTEAVVPAMATSSLSVAVAESAAPVVVEVRIERYVKKQWSVYKKVRVNSGSSYKASAKLRKGTYRARTLVTGGSAPAAGSSATRSFKVR